MISVLSFNDILAISPLLIILLAALLVLLTETVSSIAAQKCSALIAIVSIVISLCVISHGPVSSNDLLTAWLKFDSLSHFFTGFFLIIGLSSIFLSVSFFQRFENSHGEYYFLLLSALFGLILIGMSADFLTLFLGLETLSISLYVLCGYMKKWKLSHEASLKYFLMGVLGAAFLLYGIALIYGSVGTTKFNALLSAYREIETLSDRVLFLGGITFVTVGLAFKAAIVPFHTWAPDVYDGTSTPVTAFMAVGTKAGAFAAFALLFLVALSGFDSIWNQGIALLSIPTLIYANFVALRQKQLRRFFAYSGISHSGYMLMALAAGTAEALPALLFYLVIYAVGTLGAFAVLSFLDKDSEGVVLTDLHGLFRHSPIQASILTLCLLTLAGIPPTAGFFAKFFLFKVAFQAGYYALVVVGLLAAVLSAFYYLRIVGLMLSESPGEERKPLPWLAASFVGGVSAVLIVYLSVYPGPLMEYILSGGGF